MNSLTKIEPLYVTDTNALYWYLTEDKKLSIAALKVFEAAEHGETQITLILGTVLGFLANLAIICFQFKISDGLTSRSLIT